MYKAIYLTFETVEAQQYLLLIYAEILKALPVCFGSG